VKAAIERVVAVAHISGLSHGAFRLYVILTGVARRQSSGDGFFPVTLAGLLELHPGIGGRSAGATTILKQVAELKRNGLISMRAALHRNEPELPVLVKVLEPSVSEPR
jgi:hypothetical protein